MKNRLPALTATVLVLAGSVFGYRCYQQLRAGPARRGPPAMPAVASATPAELPPTAGDQLLTQARTQLERRASITARMRHQVDLDGRQLAGFGGYWQQGTGDNLHMRLELKFLNEDTSLLQISNGRFLWEDERLPAGRMVSRLDLRKVRSELSRTDEELDELEPGKADWSTDDAELSIRYGGLSTLLFCLSECFRFEPPQSMRWTPAPPLEGLPASFPVFAVVGHWKPAKLAFFAPGGKDLKTLPERLPQEVLLLFGQTDLFPYRIEFRKLLDPPATAAGDHAAPFQLSSRPLVLLELSAVSYDSQVAAAQFDYSPGDAEWNDRTADYIAAAKIRRETRLATRQADSKQ